MGQGTDSCGGYDAEYDSYAENLAIGLWTQRNGTTIHVSKMSTSHIHNAIRHAERASDRASFTSDSDKWQQWIDLFHDELTTRRKQSTTKSTAGSSKPTSNYGKTQQMICWCGKQYSAKIADLNRGWGLSCSKSHASIRRQQNKPAATRVD